MTTVISKADLDALAAAAQRESGGRAHSGVTNIPPERQAPAPQPKAPAPESVVDAVAYALRSGTEALEREDIKSYLALLDVAQLGEMCARVRRHRTHIAAKWTDEEVKKLATAWRAMRVK